MHKSDFKIGRALKWESIRWIVICLGFIPGATGILIRYLILRWLIGNSKGFFTILERVTILYPDNLKVGHHTSFNTGCWINAAGGVTIGDNVLIGPNCIIHSANHKIDRLDIPIRQQGYDYLPVVIASDVWIGANTTILPGTSIGLSAVIGAGSVVTKDIPPFAVAVGNPARVIRLRNS